MNQRESQKLNSDIINCRRMIGHYEHSGEQNKTKKRPVESREHFETRMRKFGLTEEDIKLLTKGM